jgi:hypothetical protein
LIKFHAGFIFPFLLIRRKWRAAFGFGLAALAMAAANFAVAGPANVGRYLAEVPRIAVYGGDGPPESALTPEQLALLEPLFPAGGGAIKDGFLFLHPGFEFVTNASFVELICCGLGFNWSRSVAGLAVWGFFGLAFLLLAWRSYATPVDGPSEYLYWFAITNVALLAGPTTWAMNVVWLLPALPILAGLWQASGRGATAQMALAIFVAGLALIAMPDHRSFPALFPESLVRLSIYKYPLGEGLLVLGAVTHLRRRQLEAGTAR